jgi:tetratricopeptide (TPR) repeat protein
MEVTDNASLEGAGAKLRELVNRGDGARALALAEDLQGADTAVLQLRAWTAAEVGADQDDLDLLGQARRQWAELRAAMPDQPQLLYNDGSTAEATFRAVVRTKGHAVALETQRENLDFAREAYLEVGENEHADALLRLQAFTNLGNSFDTLGRDLESIEAYDKALEIDSDFAMALGNKGMALAHVARLADGHANAVLSQAVAALDAALADREGILASAGPGAFERFATLRKTIQVSDGPADHNRGHGHTFGSSEGPWDDPYLEWCRQEGLFLHVSPGCLDEDQELLDPLFFHRLINKIDDEDRIAILQDAFNSIKQDFIAARYSAWLVSAVASPIREQTFKTSSRARFLDSLQYARWGTRVGMATQAFAAAANLLDKIACFTHLYLGTGRVKDVYFSSFWHPRRGPKSKEMESSFRAELERTETFNRGLLALCDLSCDLKRKTRLAELVERRHSATHRFLVVHEWEPDGAPTGDFLDRVSISELLDGLTWQLRTARAALIYLARSVEIREGRIGKEAEADGEVVPALPALEALSEPPDWS